MGVTNGSDPHWPLVVLFEVKFLTEDQKAALQECAASDIPIEVLVTAKCFVSQERRVLYNCLERRVSAGGVNPGSSWLLVRAVLPPSLVTKYHEAASNKANKPEPFWTCVSFSKV